ncbi:MAG: hypothetical protein KY053_00335 [Candidatus Liptonbacteria bacterium]|nr:hypothetical protein [Candidatus Liptonbacteria bacterium]
MKFIQRKILIITVLFFIILFGAFLFNENFLPRDGNLDDYLYNPKAFFLLVSVAAFIDSINPCAISILLVSVAFLLSLGTLKMNIFKIGISYILGIFITYFLIGLGFLNIIGHLNLPSGILSKFASIFLILAGSISLINVFWVKSPVKLKVPSFIHQRIAVLIQKGSVGAAFVLGSLVGVFEFPCTGMVYLAILAFLSDRATFLQGVGYLLVYNLIFVLPLVIVLFLALDKKFLEIINKWKEKSSLKRQVFAGLAMIILGVIIFFIKF